jgi:ribonuclease P protein component
MNIQRLSGRKQVLWLRRKGRVFKTKTMVLTYVVSAPLLKEPTEPTWYIGTAASVKLNKLAVKRNRMRRRCREAVRTSLIDRHNLPTLQLLIAPRSASLDAPYAQIKEDVEQFIQFTKTLESYGSKTKD